MTLPGNLRNHLPTFFIFSLGKGLGKLTVAYIINKVSTFYGARISFPCQQEPVIGSNPELNVSSPY
jgi:hypothetical protein